MSVRNGFTIEIYGFTQSTYLLACATHDTIALEPRCLRTRG